MIVFYYNKTSPAMDMVLVEGSDEVESAYQLTVDGFPAADLAKTANFTATYTSFGAEGQSVVAGPGGPVRSCAGGRRSILTVLPFPFFGLGRLGWSESTLGYPHA